jgi:hypothetical protein
MGREVRKSCPETSWKCLLGYICITCDHIHMGRNFERLTKWTKRTESWEFGERQWTRMSLLLFFFVRLLALRPLLAYCASLGWQWRWLWRSRWNVDWQGKPKFSERKLAPAPLLSVTKSHMTSPGFFFMFIVIIWFVRLLALRPLLAYCASLGW